MPYGNNIKNCVKFGDELDSPSPEHIHHLIGPDFFSGQSLLLIEQTTIFFWEWSIYFYPPFSFLQSFSMWFSLSFAIQFFVAIFTETSANVEKRDDDDDDDERKLKFDFVKPSLVDFFQPIRNASVFANSFIFFKKFHNTVVFETLLVFGFNIHGGRVL